MVKTHLLLHCKELDDVLVVQLLQHLKLPHLYVQGTQKTEVVEDFDGIEVPCFLHGRCGKSRDRVL